MYLICGEALFDVFTASEDGPGNRLTLEAVAGGSPFNVAVGLSRLGVPAALLGGISNDSFGERLRQILSDEGVLDDYLVPFEAPTTLAMVALGADGSPRYSFRGEGCADRLLREAHLRPLADDIGAIHVGSYSMVVPPIADTLHALVSRESHRRLISMDPNVRPTVEPKLPRWRERVEAFARHAHLIKASDEDLALLYPGEAPERIAQGWLKDRCELVLLTRGSKGAQLFSRRHGQFHAAARPTVVRDTVGAGDTFNAAFVAAMTSGQPLERGRIGTLAAGALQDILTFGAVTAGLNCGHIGCHPPSRTEVEAALARI